MQQIKVPKYDILKELDALCIALLATEPGSDIHTQITNRILIINQAILETNNELMAEVLSHIKATEHKK